MDRSLISKTVFNFTGASETMAFLANMIPIVESDNPYSPVWSSGLQINYNLEKLNELEEKMKEDGETLTQEDLSYMFAHEFEHIISGHTLIERELFNDNLVNMAVDSFIEKQSPLVKKYPCRYELKKHFSRTQSPYCKGTEKSWEEIYHNLNQYSPPQDEQDNNDGSGDSPGNNHGDHSNPPQDNQQNDQQNDQNQDSEKKPQPNGSQQSKQQQQNLQKSLDNMQNTLVSLNLGNNAGDTPLGIQEKLDKLRIKKVNWGNVAAKTIAGLNIDYNYRRPKQIGDVLLATRDEEKVPFITVLMDVSGSMSTDDVKDGFRNLFGWLSNFRDYRVDIHQFDCGILSSKTKITKAKDCLKDLSRDGCGGTSLDGVFDKLRKIEPMQPDACIIITDGYLDTENINNGGPIDTSYASSLVWVITKDGTKPKEKGNKVICL